MTRGQQRLVDYLAHITEAIDFAAAHPELPLSSAYQTRNAIAHGYFKVDFEIVWKTIRRDLPGLHSRVQDARASVRDQDVEGA